MKKLIANKNLRDNEVLKKKHDEVRLKAEGRSNVLAKKIIFRREEAPL
jgi:hypothetical protein